jgi:hypothetical protein
MNESHLEGLQDAFIEDMKEAITSEVAGKDPQKCFQQLYDH